MHISRIVWRKNSENSFEYGFKFLDHEKNKFDFFPIKKGQKISWTIRGPKTCIGYINQEMLSIPCPDSQVIPKSSIRCGPCSAMDYVEACIRCDGRICRAQPERWEHCKNAEYAVYCAVFKTGAVKVGVSSIGRVRTRWVEQGADYAAIIQRVTSGKVARSIESRLGRLDNITKSVRASTKAKYLLADLSLDEAQERIDNVIYQGALEHPKDYEVIDLSPFYDLSTMNSLPKNILKRGVSVEGTQMLGSVVGMKGPLLILSLDGTFSFVNSRKLIGYIIDMNSEVLIINQTGLSEFI